jgi:hypothetical protein
MNPPKWLSQAMGRKLNTRAKPAKPTLINRKTAAEAKTGFNIA